MRDLNGETPTHWAGEAGDPAGSGYPGSSPVLPLYYVKGDRVCMRRYSDCPVWTPRVTVKRLRNNNTKARGKRYPMAEILRHDHQEEDDTTAAIQREVANNRERERTQHLNEGFARLSRVVPRLPSDKMCKRQILQLAIQYIAFLSGLVRGPGLSDGQPWPQGSLLTHEKLSNAFCMSRLKGRL